MTPRSDLNDPALGLKIRFVSTPPENSPGCISTLLPIDAKARQRLPNADKSLLNHYSRPNVSPTHLQACRSHETFGRAYRHGRKTVPQRAFLQSLHELAFTLKP